MVGEKHWAWTILILGCLLLAGCSNTPGSPDPAEDNQTSPPTEPEPTLAPPRPIAPANGADHVGENLEGTEVEITFEWTDSRYTGDSLVTYTVQAARASEEMIQICEVTAQTSCEARFPVGATVRWSIQAQAPDVDTTEESTMSSFETERPVLLLHGWQGKGTEWNSWVPLLQNEGLFVLDGNATQPGTQAPSYPTSLFQDLHIPRIASEHVQPEIREAFDTAGLPSSTNFDIVAHSMGGLVGRVLAEHPGASTSWTAFNASANPDPSLRIAEDWADRIQTLVMIGTPNHGASETFLKDLCEAVNEQCRDMSQGSAFLNAMGHEGREDVHYVSVGTVEPSPSHFRDVDDDGIKHGGDCVVPAESPYLSNPSHFYILPGAYHTDALSCGSPAQKNLQPIAKIVLSELETQTPPSEIAPATRAEDLPQPFWKVNHAPTAYRVSPTQPHLSGETGQQVTLEGGCQNGDQDLDYTQWVVVDSSGQAHLQETDHAQIQDDPWTKARTYTLENPGRYQMQFRCVDTSQTTSTTSWNFTIEQARDDPPEATARSPTSSARIESGQTLEFEAACSNPEQDLDRAEWWTRSSGGQWTQDKVDRAQIQDDPWAKTERYTFDRAGTYEVRFTCYDQSAQEDFVTWTVTVEEASNQAPEASRVEPSRSSGSVNVGDSLDFTGACSNPEQDLDRGEWWTRESGGQWSVDKVDQVQWQADPWEKTERYTFNAAGTYEIRFNCFDQSGQSDAVTWTIEVN